ncbi:hypothetical protein LBMAG49_28540 [Planctomycetota bacterium]|nr:hypothetical protein LBMAG49_28540 [Planctomycetota bacterium]
MSPEIYKIAHIAGFAMLLFGLGAILCTPKDAPRPKIGAILHGSGLLVMLIAGFGALQKLHIDVTKPWVLGKVFIWVLLAALPTLLRTGILPRAMGWVVVVTLAAFGAWLAIMKPFS